MKYKKLRVPYHLYYVTWMGQTQEQIEIALCLLSQGYYEKVIRYIYNNYVKQGEGYYKLLIDLLIENEVGAEY